MIDKRKLSVALTSALGKFGFVRKGSTWNLQKEDVISVLNLQKSNYDSTYFINLGFWLRAIADVTFPKEEQCHIRARADDVWPAADLNIEEVMGEGTLTNEGTERLNAFNTFVEENIVPLLISGSTISGVIALLHERDVFLVRQVASKFLSQTRQ